MAGRGSPTFLKREKEQKRKAKAIAKRAAQQARRERKAAGIVNEDILDEEASAQNEEQDSPTGDDSPE